MSSDQEAGYSSEDGSDQEFPGSHAEGKDTVEFGWNDEPKKLTGRRKKAQQAAKKKAKPGSFETMGLSEPVLKAIRRKGYRLPTPIQRKSMPLILQGLDVVGMARTGSGKTAAFVAPMIDKLKSHISGGARAILLAPARELALQTHKVVKELARCTDLRTAVLVGGDSMEAQFAELAADPDIIVATPGRLIHHLAEVDDFSLKTVEYVVFDEADRLFEMGFAEQVKAIVAATPPSRQTLLFSATMPRLLAEFAQAGLRHPELVRLDTETKVSPDLGMAFFTVRQADKPAALLFLLREVVPQEQPTIVFASTRHHVEFLSGLLEKEKIRAAAVHGSMDQSARKINLAKFKAGKTSVLVTTDVAARGLDIPLLDNVINYDFPPKPKLFIHRAGRAARAGRTGTAYSFVSRDELAYLVDLHLYLSRPLVPAPIRSLKQAAAAAGSLQLNKATGANSTAQQGQNEESVYGAFPQSSLDDIVEHVRERLELTPELASALGAADNAFKLYVRTRPPAAPESARRAKELPKEGVHPLLAAALPSEALCGLEAHNEFAEMTKKLAAYRPSQTVFEAQVAPARAGSGAGMGATHGVLAAAPHESKLEVMRLKREAHSRAIKSRKVQQQRDEEQDDELMKDNDALTDEEEEDGDDDVDEGVLTALQAKNSKAVANNNHAAKNKRKRDISSHDTANRFRESGFYISHLPQENNSDEKFLTVADGLKDAVMDITAEDADGARIQKSSTYHWDKKSKRYVKLQPGETVRAGKRVKNESGVKVLLNKGEKNKQKGNSEGGGTTGVYEKWAKKNKMRIGAGGGKGAATALASGMGDRFKKGGRGWKNPFKADDGGGDDDGTSYNRKHRRGGPSSGSGRGNDNGKSGGNRRQSQELRNADQVRRQRKEEAHKKGHVQKRKSEGQHRDKMNKKGGAGGGGFGGAAKFKKGPGVGKKGGGKGGKGRR